VRLTWDQNDPKRMQKLQANFKAFNAKHDTDADGNRKKGRKG